MRKNVKPDFICIGPHKTGTTWLYVMLKQHPQIWLPPKKELWILNQMKDSYISRWHNFVKRTGMPGDNRKSLEEDICVCYEKNIFGRESRMILWWWVKFLFLPYTFRTYSQLFSQTPDLLSGDITPNYYFIKPDLIQKLSKHNPDIRIIIVLRDPVERAWSYTQMDIGTYLKKPFENISPSEFVDYFNHLYDWWHSYSHSIKMWKRYFQQVYVGYYDVLQEDSCEFYKQICEFLTIDNSNPPHILSEVVNKGKGAKLPLELRKHLNKQYIKEIRELAEWSDSPYPKKWLRKAEELL